MFRLPELLLWPTRRIAEYASLLAWFQHVTPPEHADQTDLTSAVQTMTELHDLVSDVNSKHY